MNKDGMDYSKLISVIVPVFNSENTIGRCIDSLISQTIIHDIEIILINDGSTDHSKDICEKYALNWPNISVIHKKNGGVSSARNTGLMAASGKYIMFCDSDDYVETEWCSSLMRMIESYKDAFISCDIFREENDRGKNGEEKVRKLSYFELYKEGLSAYLVNKIYLKEKIMRMNLLFDESCSFGEDVIFNVKYCSSCDECILLNQKLYHYVSTNGSLMNTYYSDAFRMHLPLFKYRISLIKPEELNEYCDIWLFRFLNLFKNVFYSNEISFFRKLKYNQNMIKTEEFQLCLRFSSGKNESPIIMKILKLKNYYLLWLFDVFTKSLKGVIK